jgi:hypothetical protein
MFVLIKKNNFIRKIAKYNYICCLKLQKFDKMQTCLFQI